MVNALLKHIDTCKIDKNENLPDIYLNNYNNKMAVISSYIVTKEEKHRK